VSNQIDGIDIHAHAVPAAFLDEVKRSRLCQVEVEVEGDQYFVTFPGRKRTRPIGGNMTDFARRLTWMDGQAMRHQLIAPWLDVHGQELVSADGRVWVRHLNDAMAEVVAGADGRLHAYATLHLGDGESAAKELARSVEELGLVGCMLPTHLPEGTLYDARLDPVWEAAESLNVPVVLHGPTESPSNPYFAETPQLKGTFGRTLDSTVTATMLITTGVLDRFPGLQLVLVHGGGFLPYQTGRMDAQLSTPAGHRPSEYVKRLYYDTVLMSPLALRLLIDLVGADRVMIGSDYGANPKERSAPPLTEALDSMAVDDATRRKVIHETAERSFRVRVSA
jgi:aminocarboxymuconate-semialdehyde decarboxylase